MGRVVLEVRVGCGAGEGDVMRWMGIDREEVIEESEMRMKGEVDEVGSAFETERGEVGLSTELLAWDVDEEG